MKPRHLLLLPFLSLGLGADTIVLKDGRELEGIILKDEGDSYLCQIQVTKTIRDQRRIPKADVLKIISEKKDEKDFESIKPLLPTADLLTGEDYDEMIAKVETFQKDHRLSPLSKEANRILAVLDKEAAVVRKGGIKFDGKLISAEDRQSRAYPLDAAIKASEVQTLIKQGKSTVTLRSWDSLSKEYPSSRAYVDTIPLILRMAERHLRAVEKQLETLDARIQQREQSMQGIPDRDRARSMRMIEEQSTAFAQRYERERTGNVPWPVVNTFHRDSLQTRQNQLNQEIQRLKNLDPSSIPNGDHAWTKAWQTLSGNPSKEEADQAISNAASARIPAKYLDILKEKLPSP